MPRGKMLWNLGHEPVLRLLTLGLAGLALIAGLLNLAGRSDRIWFVIVGRELTREAAAATSDRINRTVYGFHAEVFEGDHGNRTWYVAIGKGLAHADAERLKEQALGAGLTGAELWTPPPAK